MRTIHRQIKVEILCEDELSDEEKQILVNAQRARQRAQAPYSHYWVGAALLTETGRWYHGCNVERATYTQTTHAEQNAVDSMIAGEGRGTKIKLFGISGAPAHWILPIHPVKPMLQPFEVDDFCFACGHCLQIIWENCGGDPNVPLLLLTKDRVIARTTIGDAFPMRFGPESLGVDVRER
uniref:CMP/dCMP-type deaminase domain-containing protein n=1 Tax=candidate division WWE3 bacterium TaxID=2053526 RepID=A0A831Z145_UNCKA